MKVLYIISDIEKALAFEWICNAIDKERFDLRFIVLGKKDSNLISFLQKNEVVNYPIQFNGRKNIPQTWLRVYSILKKEKPDIVHTHLYYANFTGLPVAWLLRVPKRIYTRHHGSIHHKYFPVAVLIDKIMNAISTDIIVLSKNLKTIVNVWEKVPESKIHLIPHGFDLSYFENTDEGAVQSLRKRYNLSPIAYPIVGIISRYTEWKGIQFVIPAFKQLLGRFPNAHLILANATGDYAQNIKQLLLTLPDKSYTEIQFETDVALLYKVFHIFVHVPVDAYSESFGQTYVEALAAGVPSVFTRSGIASDFIINEHNALVVEFENTESIYNAIIRILGDEHLRNHLITEGKISVNKFFPLKLMIKRLETLYSNNL